MPLIQSCTVLKQLTANHTGCAYNAIILTKGCCNCLDCLFTRHREIIYFHILEVVILKGILLNNQCKNLFAGKSFCCFLYLLGSFILFFRENLIVHAHHI